jgi:hypothetical protein
VTVAGAAGAPSSAQQAELGPERRRLDEAHGDDDDGLEQQRRLRA